jgi:hypothetical protein
VENSSHEFVVVEESGVWVYVTLVEILPNAVRSDKESVIDDFHKLSWMTINSALKNLNYISNTYSYS